MFILKQSLYAWITPLLKNKFVFVFQAFSEISHDKRDIYSKTWLMKRTIKVYLIHNAYVIYDPYQMNYSRSTNDVIQFPISRESFLVYYLYNTQHYVIIKPWLLLTISFVVLWVRYVKVSYIHKFESHIYMAKGTRMSTHMSE